LGLRVLLARQRRVGRERMRILLLALVPAVGGADGLVVAGARWAARRRRLPADGSITVTEAGCWLVVPAASPF
jgi:hypothetical protein